MKKLLAILLLSASAPAALADVHYIHSDDGGVVSQYIAKYDRWAKAGDEAIVAGPCYSACVYVTRVPKACATPAGVFILHRAFYVKNIKKPASQQPHYYSAKIDKASIALYPDVVRRAIARRGGLTKKWMTIRASEILPLCQEG